MQQILWKHYQLGSLWGAWNEEDYTSYLVTLSPNLFLVTHLEQDSINSTMQADLLSLEDQLGSGRLPTHIFLLDSLSVPRNQVLK